MLGLAVSRGQSERGMVGLILDAWYSAVTFVLQEVCFPRAWGHSQSRELLAGTKQAAGACDLMVLGTEYLTLPFYSEDMANVRLLIELYQ